MMNNGYVDTPTAAVILGVTPGRVRQLLAEGRVIGTKRDRAGWWIATPVRLRIGGSRTYMTGAVTIVTCDACDGRGVMQQNTPCPDRCEQCAGEGRIYEQSAKLPA